MTREISYLERPSIDLCAAVFRMAIAAEATKAHYAIDEELRERRGKPLSDAAVDPSRYEYVSYQKQVDALKGAAPACFAASTYAVATHHGWVTNQSKFLAARRSLSDLRSIAPISASILDPVVGEGPAERFFLGLDAFASSLYESDGTREQDERVGFAVAVRVIAEAWRAWGAEVTVTGRSMPPQLAEPCAEVSPGDFDRMVSESIGCYSIFETLSGRRAVPSAAGWIVDPTDIESQFPQNCILWVLEHAVSYRLRYPQKPLAPQFGLDLLALTVSSKAKGMPWCSTEESRKPRAALVSELCWDLMLTLGRRPYAVDEAERAMRRADVLRQGSDARLVASVILEARQSVIDWLWTFKIKPQQVDDLILDQIRNEHRVSSLDEDPFCRS